MLLGAKGENMKKGLFGEVLAYVVALIFTAAIFIGLWVIGTCILKLVGVL